MEEPREASVVVIMNKDGRVLILKRTEDSYTFPNYWSFPGGGAEEEEDPFDCGAREVFEETNLKVDPEDMSFIYCTMEGGKRISYFITNKFSGDIILDTNENTLHRWVRPLEIGFIPDWIPTPKNVFLTVEKTASLITNNKKSSCD